MVVPAPSTVFDPPLLLPSPGGLVAATLWPVEQGPPRWMTGGREFRRRNYGARAFGLWVDDWCARAGQPTGPDLSGLYPPAGGPDADGLYPLPGSADRDGLYPAPGAAGDGEGAGEDRPRKTGPRPGRSEPFYPVTVWAADECDALALSRAEVQTNAGQWLRLLEQPTIERELAGRMLGDARAVGDIDTAPDLASGLAMLEQLIADTGTLGVVHGAAGLVVAAEQAKVIVRSGGSMRTPGGSPWVFGAGYAHGGMDKILVATSQTFGWRTEPVLRAVPTEAGRWYAMAERTVLVGYEWLIGAVSIGA